MSHNCSIYSHTLDNSLPPSLPPSLPRSPSRSIHRSSGSMMPLLPTKMKMETSTAEALKYICSENTLDAVFMHLYAFQDMKCCTMWHLEALRKLKKSEAKFNRTLYLTVVPGELKIYISLNSCKLLTYIHVSDPHTHTHNHTHTQTHTHTHTHTHTNTTSSTQTKS